MADFKALIELINNTIARFNKDIPSIQKKMLDDILLLTKQLNTKDDKIKIAASNIKVLSQIKGKLQKILLNPDYVSAAKDYAGSYDSVTKIQNQYFKEIEKDFKPPKLTTAIKKQAIESVVNALTESGLNTNVIDKIYELMRKAATSGGSYSSLNKQLTDFIINNESGEGHLLKYTKQISTDSLNQFSGQYSQLITSDLGLEWFRYSGSNIETTRPFCLACTERKFFHISELPEILKGNFEEFKKYGGKINSKTELPEGMYPGTDISNFQIFRGGYNCGHQWRPCSEDLVPMADRQRVYATLAYKAWANANGKKAIEPDVKIEPIPVKVDLSKNKKPENEIQSIDLSEEKPIKNIYDVRDIFNKYKASLQEYFHDTEFKSLSITNRSDVNGSTDMDGNINLSRNKARLFSEALENIKNNTELSLDHEMAMATKWHELWHNMNKGNTSTTPTTTSQRKYMELGNEFVARKTLDRFFQKFGSTLKNTSLKDNRTDTGYNNWVVNFDHYIKYVGANQSKVLEYMEDKMRNGDYREVKKYLGESLMYGLEKKGKPSREISEAIENIVSYPTSYFASRYK